MKPEIQIVLAIYVSFALLELFLTNLFNKPGQKRKDGVVEIIGTVVLLAVTQPMVLLSAFLMMSAGEQLLWPVIRSNKSV